MKILFKKIHDIWNIHELRIKIIITLNYLLIYRFSSYIPIPGIDIQGISNFVYNVNPGAKGLLQILSSFTGGAFNRASILALGIMPYISASIIIQLMGLVFPYFQKLQKEGESGYRKINNITRLLTIVICLIQAPAYLTALTTQFIPFSLGSQAYLMNIENYGEKYLFWIISIITLTSGTLFTMWIGEKITNKGIGNGISLIIMTGIIARFPDSIATEIINRLEMKNGGLIFLFFEILLWLLVIMFSILIIQAVRKIPIQYVRRKQFNFKNNYYINLITNTIRQYIPLKVISAGVMPIIFSQAIMLLPLTLLNYFNNKKIKILIENLQDMYGFWHNLVFSILIILFTFFYTAIAIPVNQIADDLKRNGGYIPKIKPGKETENYLDDILSKITFPGAILLAIIAILPSLIIQIGVTQNFALFYGGTSLLIIVGVVLDTIHQLDIYLLNSHYDELSQNKRFFRKSI